MKNKDVASLLNEIAFLLDVSGGTSFQSSAFRRAARIVERFDRPIAEVVERGELLQIKGIGEKIAETIREIIQEGNSYYLNELRSSVPSVVFDMLKLQGLGPQGIAFLINVLNVNSLEELEELCRRGHLREYRGFSEKKEKKILESIERLKRWRGKILLPEALFLWQNIEALLRTSLASDEFYLVGSLRRWCEIHSELTILVLLGSREKLDAIMQNTEFTLLEEGKDEVIFADSDGFRVRFVLVKEIDAKSIVVHTGAREFVEAFFERNKASDHKYNNEADMFDAAGLQYVVPELRESAEVISLAARHQIPELLKVEDIRGIFHIHTNFSDGADTIEQIAAYAADLGLEYVVISDHSKTAYYANGLDEQRLLNQFEEIDRVNSIYNGKVRLIKGIEVEILRNGSLDFSDDFLERVEVVIAAVHSNFNLSEEEMTRRILRALQNKYVSVLAHPTGRLLLEREPYNLNMREVIQEAGKQGVIIELNCNAKRYDLDWRWLNYAVQQGVKICLSADAHNVSALEDVFLGVHIARKGMLTAKDVVNTYTLLELAAQFPRLRLQNSF